MFSLFSNPHIRPADPCATSPHHFCLSCGGSIDWDKVEPAVAILGGLASEVGREGRLKQFVVPVETGIHFFQKKTARAKTQRREDAKKTKNAEWV